MKELPKSVSTVFSFVLVGVLLAIPFFFAGKEKKVYSEPIFDEVFMIGEHEFLIAVVEDPLSKEKGLSDTEPLGPSRGMLFPYSAPTMPGFWMKDMNYSLDLVWIDEYGIVAEVTENLSPETYPEVFYPSVPIQYVLEIQGGYASEYGIGPGTQVYLKQ